MSQEKNVIEISTDNDFEAALKHSHKHPVLVDFWAPWCPPCNNLAPVIEEIARDYQGKADIFKVNIDQHSKVTSKYGIRSIPTIIIFKDGEPIKQTTGIVNNITLEEMLDHVLDLFAADAN